MHNYSIRAAILGATGYTGRELVRLLARHPAAGVVAASSQGEAGASLRGLAAEAPDVALTRIEETSLDECDVVFCCLPHGAGGVWVDRALESGARVIDLSADMRVNGAGEARGAVYGLTELARAAVAGAAVVANPGCYPTAALLALAPLLRRGLVAGPVLVSAASGVTGAGRSPKRDLLFGEVAEDFRPYAPGNTHRHLAEIRHHAGRIGGREPELVFAPHLLPVRRGILETIHVPLATSLSTAAARELYVADYADEPFVAVLDGVAPSLRDVVGSNRVALAVFEVSGVATPALQVIAAIDNLIKGAAGQAVQNMNVLFGRPEAEGLPC